MTRGWGGGENDHALSPNLKIERELRAHRSILTVEKSTQTRTGDVVLDVARIEAIQQVKGFEARSHLIFPFLERESDLFEHL